DAVQQWLSGSPDSLALRSESFNEGIDFLAALSTSEAFPKLEVGLVVFTTEAWRQLVASHIPLVLIAAPTLILEANDAASAVAGGHHTAVTGPRASCASRGNLVLKRQ